MTNTWLRAKRFRLRSTVLALCVAAWALAAGVGATASAAAHEEPNATTGMFNYLQIAQKNTFWVYAKPGETIHVTVQPGYTDNVTDDERLCNEIAIAEPDGVITATAGSMRLQTKDGSEVTTITDGTGAVRTGTCNGDHERYQQVTLSYTVPANYTLRSMNEAFRVEFLKTTRFSYEKTEKGEKVTDQRNQGYKWRISVTDRQDDPATGRKSGRVWSTGSGNGFRVWQNFTLDKKGNGRDLDQNATNHTFTYVRQDGYRYALRHDDYQGVFSTFYGGFYGVRTKSGTNSQQAYMSYGRANLVNTNLTNANAYYRYDSVLDTTNLVYIFLDCGWNEAATSCPADLYTYENGVMSDNPLLRTRPIADDTSSVTVSGNVYDKNTIANTNADANATTGFRYTGYSAVNLTGAGPRGITPTVTVPYLAMQSGYIHLTVESSKGMLCERDILIDDSDGTGEMTWKMQQDTACDSGILKTNSPPVINPDDSGTLKITVKAIHLGEMHFIDTDAEKRGGIELKSNGASKDGTDSNRWVIWYDPFSREGGDTCGDIPVQVADGTSASGDSKWFSMSSGVNWSGTGLTNPTSTGAIAAKDRKAVTSAVSGGVHGWKPSNSCKGGASVADDGTADTESSWGNYRAIEDWTYDFRDMAPRTMSLGDSEYVLTPTITLSPSQRVIVPGQEITFTSSVKNDRRSDSGTTHWVVRRIVVPPNVGITSGTRTGTTATDFDCGYYTGKGAGVTCSDVHSGDGTFVKYSSKDVAADTENKGTTAALSIGSRICYALVVDPATQAGSPNYSEYLSCVIIAASPYLSVVGGTTWAGGSTDALSSYRGEAAITGANTLAAGFGSFGEYGVFATGAIHYFGSAGSLGAASGSAVGLSTTKLTFGSAVSLGNFTENHKITDMVEQYAAATHTATVLSGTTVDGSGVFVASGNVTLTGIAGGKNPHAVIYAPNNIVTIAGDLVYDYPGATSFKELPSLLVIAKVIKVESTVRQMAGNYYAATSFVTCNGGPTTRGTHALIATTGVCSTNRLTVNGTVTVANSSAGSLVLNRSSGGTTTGQAAEVIRMRPETYLTSYENSQLFTTVYESELPPRY